MHYWHTLNIIKRFVNKWYFFCCGAPLLQNDCRKIVLLASAPQVSAGVRSPGHWRGHLSLQRSDCLRQSRGFLCSECWCLLSFSSHRDAQLPEGTWRTKQFCYSWDNSEIPLLTAITVLLPLKNCWISFFSLAFSMQKKVLRDLLMSTFHTY